MYGKRARIGCIIPSTNTVVESEFNSMKPEGVSVHAARVLMTEVTPSGLETLVENAPAAARIIATAEVDVILFACTSGSFLYGPQWEQELVKKMEQAAGIRCITTSGAVVSALEKLDAEKIVMATPYTDDINGKEKAFLESKGFQVLKMKGLQKVTNTDVGHLEYEEAYRLAMEVFDERADAIFISCTDFRTLEVIERLEKETGKPVVTSNQASFWRALRESGITDCINGIGTLLSH